MASATASRQCWKCKDAAGSFNCAGCKEIFCLKHSNEHRQELSIKLEHLMTEQNVTLQQMRDKEPQKELVKQQIHGQIDEWKKTMIDNVCQRAEEIRRQVDELIDMKEEMLNENIQSLTNEIRTRQEKEDFFEDDLERIAQTIRNTQQAIDGSIHQSDIEVHTEGNGDIDWENLIYIEEKSNTASFSVTKKHHASKDANEIRKTKDSNSTATFYPNYYPQVLLPPPPRYAIPPHANQNSDRRVSNMNESSNLSGLTNRRPRRPLVITDPASHQFVQIPRWSIPTNVSANSTIAASINATSSPSSSNLLAEEKKETSKEQIQSDFRRQFALLLSSDPNK